jgi:hypothetical protein
MGGTWDYSGACQVSYNVFVVVTLSLWENGQQVVTLHQKDYGQATPLARFCT